MGRLSAVWKGEPLDSTNFTVYKCEVLGSHRGQADCSLCLAPDKARFGCVWCGEACVFRQSCPTPPLTNCPRPRIDVISPLAGPLEGGTLVTIEGSDLGRRREDVEGKISIAGLPCALTQYQVTPRSEPTP